MIAIFLATYAAVFVAEIVGHKLLYETGVLATRYRMAPVMRGGECVKGCLRGFLLAPFVMSASAP